MRSQNLHKRGSLKGVVWQSTLNEWLAARVSQCPIDVRHIDILAFRDNINIQQSIDDMPSTSSSRLRDMQIFAFSVSCYFSLGQILRTGDGQRFVFRRSVLDWWLRWHYVQMQTETHFLNIINALKGLSCVL